MTKDKAIFAVGKTRAHMLKKKAAHDAARALYQDAVRAARCAEKEMERAKEDVDNAYYAHKKSVEQEEAAQASLRAILQKEVEMAFQEALERIPDATESAP